MFSSCSIKDNVTAHTKLSTSIETEWMNDGYATLALHYASAKRVMPSQPWV